MSEPSWPDTSFRIVEIRPMGVALGRFYVKYALNWTVNGVKGRDEIVEWTFGAIDELDAYRKVLARLEPLYRHEETEGG